jgi:Kdo2-lipid IVA lauroyltransferase/acyltransferase
MKLRHQFERFGFWIACQLTRILPRDPFLAISRGFGSFAFRIDSRHRKIAMQNFLAAYPEATEKEAKDTIRQCYRFFAVYLFDMLTYFSGWRPERLKQFEFEGLEHLEAAYTRGKGVILFGAHLGAWEVMALAHGAKRYAMGSVVRRLDNPYLENLLEELRTSTGNFTIDKKQGFRPMLKALREGKGLAILMDQNVTTDDRVFVRFFDQPASTTPAVALLKLRTDAELIPVSSYQLAGNRYHFIYGSPVKVALTGDRQEDVRRITQACTSVIEESVRKHPECWLWMHRRWKTQPEEPVLA